MPQAEPPKPPASDLPVEPKKEPKKKPKLSMATKVKLIVIVLLVAVVVIMAFQNLAKAPVKLLFWEVQASMSLLIGINLLIGILAGLILALLMGKQKRRRR